VFNFKKASSRLPPSKKKSGIVLIHFYRLSQKLTIKHLNFHPAFAETLSMSYFLFNVLSFGKNRSRFLEPLVRSVVPVLYAWLSFITIGCQPKDLSMDLASADTLSGSIYELSSATIQSQKNMSSLLSCGDQKVQLFKVDAQGVESGPLSESTIDNSGYFEFRGLRDLKVNISQSTEAITQYSLKWICGDKILQRYVTAPTGQDLSFGTSLMNWVSQTSAGSKVSNISAKSWESIYSQIKDASTMTEAFSRITSDESIKEKFNTLFEVAPSLLLEATPSLISTTTPSTFYEEQGQSLGVQAVHWSQSYYVAYEWRIGNQVLGNLSNLTYTPTANSQGKYVIQLFVGQDDGSGHININKPYLQKTFPMDILDSVPAQAPTLAILSPSITNGISVHLQMNTGPLIDGHPRECRSFSKLALVEEDRNSIAIPPILPSSYTLDCTTASTQDVTVNLSGIEGDRIFRLWAMDASGNISISPSEVAVTLDTQAPQGQLSTFTGVTSYKGGTTQAISYVMTDSHLVTDSISIQYSPDNGGTWSSLATSQSGTGNWNWTVPPVNITTGLIKISAVDQAGNVGYVISPSSFMIDSIAPIPPVITRNSAAYSNSRVVNLSINCDSDFASVFYTETNSTPALPDSGWQICLPNVSFIITAADGLKTIYAWSKDIAGNISPASAVTMTLDQVSPTIALTNHNSGANKGGSVQALSWTASDINWGSQTIQVDYTMDNGASWTNLLNATPNDGTEAITIPTVDSSQFKFRVSGCDLAGNCANAISSNSLIVDSTPPSFASSQMKINGGASVTYNNSVQVSLDITDNLSNITDFCLKYTTGTSNLVTPSGGDSCWVPVNNPSPGLSPSPHISFNNFYFTIGFTVATYNIFVWAKDTLGNISSLSNLGSGTSGQDKASIYYDPGLPPTVVNMMATSSDSPSTPPTSSDLTMTAGSDVYIKWKATDDYALPAAPVILYYTTNETTFTQIATNVTNAANSGCTVDGTTYTGCYRWVGGAPTSGYFKVRVSVTDSSNMTSFLSSSPLNTSSFHFIAGNTDPGTGSSASSAVIFNYIYSMGTEARTLVVAPNGKFYIRDNVRGIVSIDPADGKLNVLVPYTGISTDGPIGTATLGYSSARLSLDFQGNIVIGERYQIRKLDLSTNTISTLIGGGASTSSGIPANQLAMDCNSTTTLHCPLTVLPNGDIYFFRRSSGAITAGDILYFYKASDGKVYSIFPSGIGATNQATLDITTSKFYHFGLEFDPITSQIQRFFSHFLRQPCVGCGEAMYPALLDQTTWASTGSGYSLANLTSNPHSFVNSMDGRLYSIPENSAQPRALWRLERGTNNWTKILGSNKTGSCTDGTLATSCDVYLQDAFIAAQGQVYFLDNGLVRTIDENNQVKTLFGQRRSFGDGGTALSARFNSIFSIDETSSGKIVLLDQVENLLREITVGGNITKLGGNGTGGSSTSGVAAIIQAVPGSYWGSNYQVYVDRATDDVFFTAAPNSVFRYTRSTGLAEKVIGGGSTAYYSGDGLVGTSLSLGSYPIQLLGFDGTKLIGAMNVWNGAYQEKGYWKFFDKSDSFRQSQFAGNNSVQDGSYVAFPSGSAVPTTNIINGFYDYNLRGYWDAGSSTWYFGGRGTSSIRALPIGGVVSTFVSLPRTYISWTMIKNASSQWVVYYCSGGRIYKYNASSSSETALSWPSASISCLGDSMFRSATRNSIVFPYSQNGLVGIAEIVNPP
jgi:hypothetical protein